MTEPNGYYKNQEGGGNGPEKQGLLLENNAYSNANGDKNVSEKGADYEKKGLLPPVSLNPGWEANTDKSEDALNFKDEDDESDAPIDKYRIVYFILLLHGVGTLMPWNMFITANSYFEDYKLGGNSTESEMYRSYFLSFLGFTAQIPNVILNGLNLFCRCGGGNNAVRIVWSIIIVVIMFIVTVILAMIDSSEWPGPFFWITMVTVVIINMANGVYQNSVYGTAACLPMKYTNAVVLGSNISGTLTSVLMIISIASAPDPRTSAIYYFLAAIFVLLVAFDTYFALPLIPFYRYYQKRAQAKQDIVTEASDSPPFWEVFKKCWVQDLGVFFVFFVTLTCFPAIQAGIKRADTNFFIPATYFTPVVCFLFFNAFAMLGNLTTEFVKFPSKRFVWIPVLLRGLFIPFFMFCNYSPDSRMLPVLITNDYVYMVFAIIMAYTSGYFSSLTMMYAPSCVEPQHAGTAGMMAAFFLISGIFGGVVFSFPTILFIKNVGSGSGSVADYVNATMGFNATNGL